MSLLDQNVSLCTRCLKPVCTEIAVFLREDLKWFTKNVRVDVIVSTGMRRVLSKASWE